MSQDGEARASPTPVPELKLRRTGERTSTKPLTHYYSTSFSDEKTKVRPCPCLSAVAGASGWDGTGWPALLRAAAKRGGVEKAAGGRARTPSVGSPRVSRVSWSQRRAQPQLTQTLILFRKDISKYNEFDLVNRRWQPGSGQNRYQLTHINVMHNERRA